MPQIAMLLIITGVVLVIAGLVFWLGQKYLQWFGHLPGDIRIEKEKFKVFVPVTSMIVVSILLNLVPAGMNLSGWLWIIRRFFQ